MHVKWLKTGLSKISSVLCMTGLALAGFISPALAGGSSFSFGYGSHFGNSHYNLSYGYHSGYRHHYRPYRGYHRPHFRGHHRGGFRHHGRHGHHGIDAGEALAVGLIGLGIGYAISREASRPRADRVIVREAPPGYGNYSENWHRPPKQTAPAQQQSAAQIDCVEIKEYESSVEIDGVTVPTYGEACLARDGTWHLGPPTIGAR